MSLTSKQRHDRIMAEILEHGHVEVKTAGPGADRCRMPRSDATCGSLPIGRKSN